MPFKLELSRETQTAEKKSAAKTVTTTCTKTKFKLECGRKVKFFALLCLLAKLLWFFGG
jgi:hypothetical protein